MGDVVLGIDLGTTFSAVAWVNEAGTVEVIPNREGSNLTPSVVLVDDGKFIVGQEALFQSAARPNDVAQWIKRQIGSDFLFAGQYTPEQISAEILRKLVRDASEFLGRAVDRAVVTVPAYFTAGPLAKTREAGEMAGLRVESLLHEPEAAAIHFGVDHLNAGECVLVCDLGGGTYDATVLYLEDGVLKADKTRGSRELGGHDWTVTLMDMLAERIAAATGTDPREDELQWQRLYDLCEAAKKQLSSVPKTMIAWSSPETMLPLEITRQEFEVRCEPLMNQVLDKTAEAISESQFSWAQVEHVVLVGGSSRLPSFVGALEQLTGKKPRRTRNPDEAVVRGAALVAHGIATGEPHGGQGRITIGTAAHHKITLQRRTTFALGIIAYSQTSAGRETLYERFIEENADMPVSVTRTGFVIAAGQTAFQIPVVQLDCHNAPQHLLGTWRFEGAPARDHEAPVLVRFEYDANGIPDVSAIDVETGNKLLSTPHGADLAAVSGGCSDGGDLATVVLAVDCSGSMIGDKMNQAKRVLTELAEKYVDLGRRWSVALVNFGGGPKIYPSKILLQPTQSLGLIRASAQNLCADGDTPMAAALANVRAILEPARGTRVAIIITDGMPYDVLDSKQMARALKTLGIRICTVPVGADADRAFLKEIGDLESEIKVDDLGGKMSEAVIDLLRKI